ncbi:RNI-like protein [Atractiella rhizophila]|nr:RNI-like protein [Atractiella rhizophila]
MQHPVLHIPSHSPRPTSAPASRAAQIQRHPEDHTGPSGRSSRSGVSGSPAPSVSDEEETDGDGDGDADAEDVDALDGDAEAEADEEISIGRRITGPAEMLSPSMKKGMAIVNPSGSGGGVVRSRRDTIRASLSSSVMDVSDSLGGIGPGGGLAWRFPSYLQTNGELPPSPAFLPHEIIIHIFRFLPLPSDLKSALLVCKSWCHCAVEFIWFKPSLGTQISNFLRMLIIVTRTARSQAYQELFADEMGIGGEDVEMLEDGPPSPTASVSAEVDGEGGEKEEERAPTFAYPRYIRRLNFSLLAQQIDDPILRHLLPCTRLERLTLNGCTGISDAGLIPLVRRLKGLVALDLSECVGIADAGVVEVGRNCRRLQGLNLTGCKNVGDEGVMAVAAGCPGMRRQAIDVDLWLWDDEQIKMKGLASLTDSALIALCASCPLLLEIDIALCTKVTPKAFWTLFRLSTHLRELVMTQLPEIDETAFPISTCISRIPIDSYREEIRLTLPSSFDALASTLGTLDEKPFPPVFDHLRFLDLSQLSRLTDAAVDGIVTQCPRIRNLLLAKCNALTDEALNSVGRLGKHLHYLHLGHVNNITDKAVIRLARNCTRLRYIDLACCPNLTDLSRIGLVRVQNLTDSAIYALVERSSLERIHLSYCERITVSAIHFLLTRLTKLTHLSLTGVPAFRRNDLQSYCRPAPKDFNAHQRTAFCVYSGKGVADLRRYLTSLAQNRGYNPIYYGRATDAQLEAPSDATERLQYQTPFTGAGPGGPLVPGAGMGGRRGGPRHINVAAIRQQMESHIAAGTIPMDVDPPDWPTVPSSNANAGPSGHGHGHGHSHGQRSLSLPPAAASNAGASTSRMPMGSPHPQPQWLADQLVARNGREYRLIGRDETGRAVYELIEQDESEGTRNQSTSGSGRLMPGAFERSESPSAE